MEKSNESKPDKEIDPNNIEPAHEADAQATPLKIALGIIAIIAGLPFIAAALYLLFTDDHKVQKKGVVFIGAIGILLISMGCAWVRGKKFIEELKIDANEDTLRAGRAGMFNGWTKTSKEIIDKIRPAILETGAVFYSGPNKYQVRVGWPGWVSEVRGQMALIKQKTETTFRIELRVGKESGLISEDGPLFPVEGEDGITKRDYGYYHFNSPELPSELFDWIKLASSFTQEKCKSPKK